MCNTTMYQAFGSYLRNKNGKLQKRFSLRPTTGVFEKVSNSDDSLYLTPLCHLSNHLLTAAGEILKLYSFITPWQMFHTI